MTRIDRGRPCRRAILAAAAVCLAASAASAQTAGSAAPENAPQTTPLPLTIDALGWLEGCWRGAVNQREFREYWLPLKGGMIVGAGHTIIQDKTQDYEYMRIEARPDGVYYVVVPSGKPEASFKLTSAVDDGHGVEFTFTSGGNAFPQRIVYRRGLEGWLFASIDGTLNGEERKVTYPLHRIVCESGERVDK